MEIARFSVPDKDIYALPGTGLRSFQCERETALRFWPGVRYVEFHTKKGKGIMTVQASQKAMAGIRRYCAWVRLEEIA